MANYLDYKGIDFSVSKKDFRKIEKKSICINVFCYENNLVYPVHISDKKCKDCIDLLLITDENNSHYVYIRDFNKFMWNKTRCRNKKPFFLYCLQYFSSERVLVEHKEICFKISGKQSAKIRSGSIKFKNHFKQLAVPFMIYADFESVLKRSEGSDKKIVLHTRKNISHIFLAVLLTKLFVLMINLVNQLLFTGETCNQ